MQRVIDRQIDGLMRDERKAELLQRARLLIESCIEFERAIRDELPEDQP